MAGNDAPQIDFKSSRVIPTAIEFTVRNISTRYWRRVA